MTDPNGGSATQQEEELVPSAAAGAAEAAGAGAAAALLRNICEVAEGRGEEWEGEVVTLCRHFRRL